jgi:hypothetical protein
MVEFPQSAARMIPACGNLYELIVNQVIAHDGDPMFTDQVLSAAQRQTESGWRLSKVSRSARLTLRLRCYRIGSCDIKQEVAPVAGFFVV